MTRCHPDRLGIGGAITNEAQKLFATENEPHIFGYAGSVDYPVRALRDLVNIIDNERFFSKANDCRRRQAMVQAFLKDRLNLARQNVIRTPFSIVHGAREHSYMNARFHLWVSEWSPSRGWKTRKKYMRGESVLLYSTGSGKTRLRTRNLAWKRSEIGKKSRGVFGAFCEALQSGADPQSGGPPQLVGVFDRGNGRYFGVIYNDRRYLKGRCIDKNIPAGYNWFNETFECVDPYSKTLLRGRQRQPKPRTLTRARRVKSLFD